MNGQCADDAECQSYTVYVGIAFAVITLLSVAFHVYKRYKRTQADAVQNAAWNAANNHLATSMTTTGTELPAAPVVSAVPASTIPVQQMQVMVPDGVVPGQNFQVNTPSGVMMVTAQAKAGDMMTIEVPMAMPMATSVSTLSAVNSA